MSSPTRPSASAERTAADLAAAVEQYRAHANMSTLLAALSRVADDAAGADTLAAAVEPFRDIPEVAGPIYERIVAERPADARALVILANAYWLAGRGPDAVAPLATRAIAADPANRGAWHLWALTEANPRARTERWRQVSARFPNDPLAKASFADNAASLAGAEHDPVALKLAIAAYEELRDEAVRDGMLAQRDALDRAITALRAWRV